MATEKKQPIFEKYYTKFTKRQQLAEHRFFVNTILFQNGNLDSAYERQQVFAYQWTECDFNSSSVHENLSKLKTEENPPNTSARLSEEFYYYRQYGQRERRLWM